jgi:nitric oxide dioxygenase
VTSEQKHLVRKSFREIERAPEVAALIFYRRLFEIAPGLRPLFKHDIEAQAAKLMEMLGFVLCLLEMPVRLATELEALGARHVGYGVKDEHYAVVGRAMVDMLGEVLDARFTPEVRVAWLAFYTNISDAMRRGAQRQQPGIPVPSPGSPTCPRGGFKPTAGVTGTKAA